VVQVALVIVAVLPFPEESATVGPVPSLNEYAATGEIDCAAAGAGTPPQPAASARPVINNPHARVR
jgi:hypothetical protein